MRISRKGAGNPGGGHAAASTTYRVLNVFGSLAVASVLTWGGAGLAESGSRVFSL